MLHRTRPATDSAAAATTNSTAGVYHVAITKQRCDPTTRAYIARRVWRLLDTPDHRLTDREASRVLHKVFAGRVLDFQSGDVGGLGQNAGGCSAADTSDAVRGAGAVRPLSGGEAVVALHVEAPRPEPFMAAACSSAGAG